MKTDSTVMASSVDRCRVAMNGLIVQLKQRSTR